MATILNTDQIGNFPHEWDQLQIYNALDCCVTVEVFKKRLPLFNENTRMVYDFEKDLQAPFMEMSLRGIRVDEKELQNELVRLKHDMAHIEAVFEALCRAAFGTSVNWNSSQALDKLFHQWMGLPGQGADREMLENLQMYFHAAPLCRCVLALRDRKKLKDTLLAKRKRTGRFHAQFKMARTVTGRAASAKDHFDEGANLQNQTERSRKIFIADPGMKLAYVDLEQAESRAVAYIAGDEKYIEACESGDLHTTVCRLIWADKEWTDDPKKDKEIAEEKFYRWFSYRDMSKRGGHGTNYYGKPGTMAMHLKIQKVIMEKFQDAYFKAFPGIRKWHTYVAITLQTAGKITTAFGRERCFFGRPQDDSTLRAAIAHDPQSVIGDLLNSGLLKVWKTFPEVELLAQVHDAILFQYPAEKEAELLPAVEKSSTNPGENPRSNNGYPDRSPA
jgi:DNA polymerase I-like protein with 3'-5' exonuclease and polymerase domains